MRFRLLLFVLLWSLASTTRALEVLVQGDRLTLRAHKAPLADVLQGFVRAGILVKVDPSIQATVSGNLDDAALPEALDKLLEKFSYALIWDVIDGPVGPLPKLAEIRIFRRDTTPEYLQPLPPPNENLEVTTGPAPQGSLFVKDEILLAVKPGTRLDEFKNLIKQIGGMIISSVPSLGVYQVRLPAGTNVLALIAQLEQKNMVAQVEPNYVVRVPPPLMEKGDSPSPPASQDVVQFHPGAPPVAILDSGLVSLPGLQNLVVGELDALAPDRALRDASGHGTQMALIASGAVRPDGTSGGSPDGVPLVAIRAFDDNGYASNFSLMRSIDFALSKGARVLNMSWGANTDSRFIENAVAYAQSKGAVVVASAGNEPTGQPVYPAAYPGVVAVTALDNDGTLWKQSNYGDFAYLAAPGRASFPIGHKGPPGAYAGTSISSAYVARSLGLYFARHPNASAREATTALRNSLTDAGPTGKDSKYGHGALDAAAMQRFLALP